MADSVLKLKKVVASLPSVTRYILIASFAAILIGCAYYIYKTYISPQSDRSMIEGYASGMDIRNNHPNEEVVTLYFFGVEWCPHCKHAKPEWESFVKDNENKTFNGKKVNFVMVDCDKDSALADKYDVSGYPTIKLDTGADVIEFKSKPEKDALTQFLNNSL